MPDPVQNIQAALSERFGESFAVDAGLTGLDDLARIAAHRVHRRWLDRDVAGDLLRLLCACALSAPSKSDLQQADILIVRDRHRRSVPTPDRREMAVVAPLPGAPRRGRDRHAVLVVVPARR